MTKNGTLRLYERFHVPAHPRGEAGPVTLQVIAIVAVIGILLFSRTSSFDFGRMGWIIVGAIILAAILEPSGIIPAIKIVWSVAIDILSKIIIIVLYVFSKIGEAWAARQ